MSYLDMYKSWLNSPSGGGIANSVERATKNQLSLSFKDSPFYREVVVEDTTIGVRIIPTKKADEKEIFLLPDAIIDLGAKFFFDDDYWIAIESFVSNDIFPKVKVGRCNNRLQWIDAYGNQHNEPCIVKAASTISKFTVDENEKDVDLLDGYLLAKAQYNSYTKSIFVDQRFILGSQIYKVTGYNDATDVLGEKGIIYFTLTLTTKQNGDNFETGVAQNVNKKNDTNNTVSKNWMGVRQ